MHIGDFVVPKITNEYYKAFCPENDEDQRIIDLVTEEQFKTWLEKIPTQRLPYRCTPEQAQALFITVFYTGRRPDEISELRAKDILFTTLDHQRLYELRVKTLKNGKQNPIYLPVNKYTIQLYTYMKKFPEDYYVFWAFRKETKNQVKWHNERKILVQETNAQGLILEKDGIKSEDKLKHYIRRGALIGAYIKFWTGRPAYWFRHHRFSAMYANGASDSEVQMFKGAKDPASVEPYKHLSSKMAKKIAKTFKF